MPIRDTEFGADYHVGFGGIKAESSKITQSVFTATQKQGQPSSGWFKQIKMPPTLQRYFNQTRSVEGNPENKPRFLSDQGGTIQNANPIRFDNRRGFDIFKAPEVNLEADRRQSILDNKPARFKIEDNPKATGERKILSKFTKPETADKIVRENSQTIEKISQKHGIDPDFVKAVMWTETYRGDYLGLNRKLDKTDFTKSKLPMNINGQLWSKIIDKRADDLFGKGSNIEAGVVLLKRIQDRLDDPSPDKVGSLWNALSAEHTNDVGVAIGKAYKEKPWLKKK